MGRKMSLNVTRKPLGLSNIQNHQVQVKKEIKVQAKADSTGVENEKMMIIKHHHSVKKPQTDSVVRRNLRERTRVRGVNDGFGKLKQFVPNMKNKSSKVETLRGAIQYIKQLKELLGEEIDYSQKTSIKLKEEDVEDDSLPLSDLDTSKDRPLLPLVYQLPSPFPASSPLLLPPTYTIPTNLPNPTTARLPSVEYIRKEKNIEKLPSMSITAPAWWPEK